MQSVHVPLPPLLNSLISNIHSNATDYLQNPADSIVTNSSHYSDRPAADRLKKMPKSPPPYVNDNAICTELECFIAKTSSSDSLRMNGDDFELDDLSLSSGSSEHDQETSGDRELSKTDNERKKYKKTKHEHVHRQSHRRRFESAPEWLLHLASMDQVFSNKIHRLSLGAIDYLFVFGAFVFGSKFMPITILLSIFLVDVPGFIYLLLSCTITVIITEFGKKFFGRHRPDPKTLAPKKLDFRTRLTNYSFPSGDTAQSAAYSMSLFCLTSNVWLLLFIPNCAWSRVYFGCHWICDCIIGALIGCAIPLLVFCMIPQQFFVNTQHAILSFLH